MTNHNSRPARWKAWAAMLVVSLTVAGLAFVVFILMGGLMLIVGLNGMTSKQAEPIFLIYTLLVFGGATLVAALCNWLVIRRGFPAAGLPSWAALVPAAFAAGVVLAAPALVFIYG